MARLSLEILHQLLKAHVISPEDFTGQHYTLPSSAHQKNPQLVALPKPPGHVILEHILNDSALLKKVRGNMSDICFPS